MPCADRGLSNIHAVEHCLGLAPELDPPATAAGPATWAGSTTDFPYGCLLATRVACNRALQSTHRLNSGSGSQRWRQLVPLLPAGATTRRRRRRRCRHRRRRRRRRLRRRRRRLGVASAASSTASMLASTSPLAIFASSGSRSAQQHAATSSVGARGPRKVRVLMGEHCQHGSVQRSGSARLALVRRGDVRLERASRRPHGGVRLHASLALRRLVLDGVQDGVFLYWAAA